MSDPLPPLPAAPGEAEGRAAQSSVRGARYAEDSEYPGFGLGVGVLSERILNS